MCGFQALSYLSDARVVDIWEVIGTDVHRHRSFCADLGAYYPRIEFTVYLDRKPLFYIVNIIVPVFFLVMVVLMVGLPAVALSRQSLFCVRTILHASKRKVDIFYANTKITKKYS